ncbi:MAG: hypothetical protein GY769_04320 [bacterium]|nr:hypothetical protein [bacterium]
MIRYIFSINPGRAGSHYLSLLLSEARGCVSMHEPEPVMNGCAMRRYLRGDEALLRSILPEKVAAIERSRGSSTVYAESNHCFIKGFGWLLPELLPREKMALVVLRRDREALKRSFQRILSSPFLRSGDDWIITPLARPRQVPLPLAFRPALIRFHVYRALARTVARPGVMAIMSRGRRKMPAFMRRYESALLDWYFDEVEARTRRYRESFPEIRMVEVDLRQLNTSTGARRLFRELDLEPEAGFETLVGRATNQKASL